MNSLQLELDSINSQLELLTYRKTQLDSIMSEYSDVVNRVKSLVDLMNDAMVEPSNLLMEIEGIIFNVQPEEQPEEQEPMAEEPKHFNFDLRLFPLSGTTLNSLGLPVTPEPAAEPEPVKLMACVPVKSPAAENLPVKLNSHAYRRNDTLLIGFTNKKLLNQWMKWIKDSWGDSVNVTIDTDDEPSKGFPFPHCLSVLWYGNGSLVNWERLKALDYSLKPDEQPSGITLDDVRNIILKLQNNGLKFISKGELLAHHLNSLKASDLEDYLDKLAEEGLIILGNKSIDLCVKPSEQKQD